MKIYAKTRAFFDCEMNQNKKKKKQIVYTN